MPDRFGHLDRDNNRFGDFPVWVVARFALRFARGADTICGKCRKDPP